MAQLLLATAGGFVSGGPAGAALALGASLVETALTPRQKFYGPRLNDLSGMSSEIGKHIPLIYGRMRVGGNVIWSPGIKEVSDTSGGGKGKPSYTDYKYFANFAIMVSANQFQRLEKLWFGSRLIYDYNNGDEIGYQFTYDSDTGTYSGVNYVAGETVITGGHWHGAPTTTTITNNGDGSKIRIYTGTQTQLPDSLIQTNLGVNRTSAHRGKGYIVFENFPLITDGNQMQSVTALLRNTVVGAGDICTDIALRAKYTEDDLDFTSMDGLTVRGFATTQASEARELIELIANAKKNVLETSTKIKTVAMGGGSIVTIPVSDQGVIEIDESFTGDNDEGVIPGAPSWVRNQTLELPRREEIQFINPNNQYKQDTRYSEKQGVASQSTEGLSFPMAMLPSEAQNLADVILNSKWAQFNYREESLSWKYLWLSNGDVITVTTPSGPGQFLIKEKTERFFGPLTLKLNKYSQSAYDMPMDGDGTELPPIRTDVIGDFKLVFLNTNSVVDSMNEHPGLYILISCLEGSRFSGISLKSDGFRERTVNLGSPCDLGDVVTPLLTPINDGIQGSNFFDPFQFLTVDMWRGQPGTMDLDDPDIYGDVNTGIVGREIIKWQKATVIVNPGSDDGLWNGKKRYKLEGIARGLRGTEPFMDYHGYADETFVICNDRLPFIQLEDSAISYGVIPWAPNTHFNGGDQIVPTQQNGYVYTRDSSTDDGKTNISEPTWPVTLGVTVVDNHITWKNAGRYQGIVITVAGLDTTSHDLEFSVPGSNLFPYAAKIASGVWDGTTKIDIDWLPRSRYSNGGFSLGTGPIIGESIDAYEVDVLDAAGNVVRTIKPLVLSQASYTAVDIDSDFGSIPSSIHFRIYQLNNLVKRGYGTDLIVVTP